MTHAALRLACLFVLACVSPAAAEEPGRVGDLLLEGVWARATPESARQGAAYMIIRNDGHAAERLIGGSAPVAARVELHQNRQDGGVMRMRPVDAVEIPAGAATALAPGGYHVMLIELAAPLREGERFPLTLRFERAGEIALQVPIQRGPPQGLTRPGGAPGHTH